MPKFWTVSFALSALYGAVVVGMGAAISHYFQYRLVTEEFSALLSSTAMLAVHGVTLLTLSAIGIWGRPLSLWQQRWCALVVAAMHLGLWLFVYTVWAGLFELPLHYRFLAPIGGQTLLVAWLALMAVPFIRK